MSKDWLNFLKSQNLIFVERKNKSHDYPQVRLIEKYWALCKKEYKNDLKNPKVCMVSVEFGLILPKK
jgi:hypothetical protein